MSIFYKTNENGCKTISPRMFITLLIAYWLIVFLIGLMLFIVPFSKNMNYIFEGMFFQNIIKSIVVYFIAIIYSIIATKFLIKYSQSSYIFAKIFSILNNLPQIKIQKEIKNYQFDSLLNNYSTFVKFQLKIYTNYINSNTSSFILEKLKK